LNPKSSSKSARCYPGISTSILVTLIALILSAVPCKALIVTSSKGVDTLPDKIFDDLVIRDKQAVSLKLNEIGGDLIISAEKINVIANQVGGNLNSVGVDIFIGGRIRQSARMLGHNISTDANIGRNLTIAALPMRNILGLGSQVDILRECRVGKDIDIDASSVNMQGEVGGNLRIKGEIVRIGGIVEGNATIIALRELHLEPSCRIEGILTYSSPKEAEIEEGAQVISGIIDYEKISYRGLFDLPLSWRIISGVAAFLVGIVFVLIFRKQILNLLDILLTRFGQALGLGILAAAAMAIYTAVFLSTLMFALFYKPVFVLIPILTIAFIIFAVLFYLANILVAIFLGRLIILKITGNVKCSPGRSLILGLIILVPVYGIPVVGIYLYGFSALIGFGAFMIAIFRKIKYAS
jgi:hypothetical protein